MFDKQIVASSVSHFVVCFVQVFFFFHGSKDCITGTNYGHKFGLEFAFSIDAGHLDDVMTHRFFRKRRKEKSSNPC